jgi:hypothetical protein
MRVPSGGWSIRKNAPVWSVGGRVLSRPSFDRTGLCNDTAKRFNGLKHLKTSTFRAINKRVHAISSGRKRSKSFFK